MKPARTSETFAVDGRRFATNAVRAAFPGITQGEIRRLLVVAIARSRTPAEAAHAVDTAAAPFQLTTAQRQDVTVIVAKLTAHRHTREAP